ncbi:MAG: efflux RND transporter periplasmic adaptor subunit [Planctomycetota bacterium]
MKTLRSRCRGGSPVVIVSIVMLATALGTGALMLRAALSPPENGAAADQHLVRRGSFEISIPASGELAAKDQIEIRNKLDYRAVITQVIDEGEMVKAGDVLVEFASDEIEEKIKDADDALNSAQTQLITAQSNLETRLIAIQSEWDKANLDVTLAELALEAWENGEDVSRKKELELQLETATINHERLVERYAESQVLAQQEFISQDELKRDKIAMIEAAAKLTQAELDIEVYQNYERKEAEARKNSDVEQALAERERIRKRHEAQELTARREVESKKHQFDSRTERLADLREQLELCTIRAPSEGLVVYAGSLEDHRWSRMNRGELQAGTELRKNELIMILPDTSRMAAEVKVNESLTGLIEPGQRAIVTSDAVPDVALEGEVIEIGVLAETGGWRDPNRRDYTVTIQLSDGNELGLKPSMRCKSEIYVGRVDDVIHVPLQAVFREGPAAYVYVPRDSGFAQHEVEIGKASGLHAEITAGLEEGDIVLLREAKPREIVARLADKAPPEARAGRGEAPDGQPPHEQSRGGRPPRGQAALGADKGWSKSGKGRPQRGAGREKGGDAASDT